MFCFVCGIGFAELCTSLTSTFVRVCVFTLHWHRWFHFVVLHTAFVLCIMLMFCLVYRTVLITFILWCWLCRHLHKPIRNIFVVRTCYYDTHVGGIQALALHICTSPTSISLHTQVLLSDHISNGIDNRRKHRNRRSRTIGSSKPCITQLEAHSIDSWRDVSGIGS
jgi:hypothetical protein